MSLRLVVIKFCGLMGFFLAAVHAFFSLSLLTPAYYGKYFDAGGRLNLQGELAMTFGVIALFFLLSPAVTTLPMMPKALGGWRWKRTQRAGYVALSLVLVHLVVLGLKGWLAPEGWNGGLPPISLLAAVAALVPLLVKRKRDSHDREERKKSAGSLNVLTGRSCRSEPRPWRRWMTGLVVVRSSVQSASTS